MMAWWVRVKTGRTTSRSGLSAHAGGLRRGQKEEIVFCRCATGGVWVRKQPGVEFI